MKNKKALLGWHYIVVLIVAILVLVLVLYASFKSQGSTLAWIDNIKEIFA